MCGWWLAGGMCGSGKDILILSLGNCLEWEVHEKVSWMTLMG